MWDRVEIKRRGKAVFKANYWRSVLSAFLLSLLVGGSALSAGSNMDDDNANYARVCAELKDTFGNKVRGILGWSLFSPSTLYAAITSSLIATVRMWLPSSATTRLLFPKRRSLNSQTRATSARQL